MTPFLMEFYTACGIHLSKKWFETNMQTAITNVEDYKFFLQEHVQHSKITQKLTLATCNMLEWSYS